MKRFSLTPPKIHGKGVVAADVGSVKMKREKPTLNKRQNNDVETREETIFSFHIFHFSVQNRIAFMLVLVTYSNSVPCVD